MCVSLPTIKPKSHHNYVAFFLTFTCNLKCNYCINHHNGISRNKKPKINQMSNDEWIAAANRLILRDDLPLTLQGGEPTQMLGFYRFVNEVKPEIKMDLLTNLTFDVEEFIINTPIARFTRQAPYASIRASYHPWQNNIKDLIQKVFKLQEAGFHIGLYGIAHPDKNISNLIKKTQDRCLALGIDFRTKEFIGEFNGKIYGEFRDASCVNGSMKHCKCRTTELIVGPSGYIHHCHADLYKERNPIAHILDEGFNEDSIDIYRFCNFYGNCHPCDVKIKNDRFQNYGHSSVEIIDIGE